MRTRALLLTLVSLLLAPPLFAQAKKKGAAGKPAAKAVAPAPATPVQLEIVQVNDRRSSGHFANLNVHVKLPGVKASEVLAERVIATRATDDTGKDLAAEAQKNDALTPTSAAMGMGGKGPEESDGLPLTVMLASPARGATAIKELAGEIELYVPARDPQSRVTIEKVLGKTGKPLASPALAANRVQITLLSGAALEAARKKMTFPPEQGELIAKVVDPDKRVQDFWYVTPSGEPKRVVAMDRDGYAVLSSWGGAPQADWALRVDLKTAKALARHTFTLSDVPLP